MLPSQIKAFNRALSTLNQNLLAELQAIRSSLQEQIRAIRDASEAANETREQIPKHLAELRVPVDEKTEANAYRNKAHHQQIWLTWGTWLAFIAASFYAYIAYKQKAVMVDTYREIQKQTTAAQCAAKAAQDQAKLLREQLEGSEAAYFEFRPNLSEGSDSFWPSAYNWGHLAAKNLHIEIAFEERTIPDRRIVAKPQVFTIDAPVAPAQKHAIGAGRRTVKIDWDSVHALRTFVQANLNYRYDDGFGTIVNGSECWVWVAHEGGSPPPTCSELDFIIETQRKNQQSTQQK
jgi:hypothetical protein